MDAMSAFVSPLGAARSVPPVQVQGRPLQSAPGAVRGRGAARSASAATIASSALGALVVLSATARLAGGARKRLLRRRSVESGPDVPVPKYPGAADREKMREFAEQLQDFYREGGQLPIGDLMALLQDAETFFTQQKALVYVEVPKGEYLNVVGDVHGQLFDFLSIFERHGLPSEENPFLFNGDFVDRGSYSVEIMVLLLAWKLAYPEHMHLARGNHEDADMNFSYGFTGEVLVKYGAQLAVWAAFQRVFLNLPLSHVVNNDVFVTHGGLPRKEGITLADIEALDVMEDYDLMSDLMWADPRDIQGVSTGERGGNTIVFGEDVTQRFLERNSLSFMIRSHEVKEQGYEWQHGQRCLTVFSAPCYCDFGDNKGAVVRLHAQESGRMEPEILPFRSAEKPENYVRCMAFTQPGLTEQLWSTALQQAGVTRE
mmetsp:Transcript_4047/g.9496  ORF Transcript_4047/g.9496 Transcript_4047/m.9496 type:complete len:429 (-) Transcript_4047:204-1490(-)